MKRLTIMRPQDVPGATKCGNCKRNIQFPIVKGGKKFCPYCGAKQ